MARRKSFPSSLVLSAFISSLLISSNSASVTFIPSWTTSHQLHTRSPEFNVISAADGVPTLESGEKPAKDPQIIVEGPLPIDTPDPFEGQDPTEQLEDEDIIKSTPIPLNQDDDDGDDDGSIHLPPGNSNLNHDRDTEPSVNAENGNPEGDDTEGPLAQSPLPEASKAAQSSKKPKSSKKAKPAKSSQTSKTPKSSKEHKPSTKPANTTGHHDNVFNDSPSEHPDLDETDDWTTESSPQLEDDTHEHSGVASDQDLSGDQSDDNGSFLPEPSALPNYISTSKPSNSPVAWPSNSPSSPSKAKQANSLEPSNAATFITATPTPKTIVAVSIPKPSVSVQLNTAVPNNGEMISEGSETEPEPSFLEAEAPDLSLSPTKTGSVPNPSSNVSPTAVLPLPEPEIGSDSDSPSPSVQSAPLGSNESAIGSKEPTQESKATSSEPTAIVIEPETTSTDLPNVAGESTDEDKDSLEQPSSEEPEDVVLDDTYSCIFFGEGDVPGFSSANLELFNGTVDTYTAATAFGTLPAQYLSHTFGKFWTYSLLTDNSMSYDIVLGFAEIFEPACVSDVSSGFRVFSVSIDTQSAEIDVVGTVGCGKPLQKIFPKVSPENGVINLHFEGIVQNAMLSTMCYRQSEAKDDSYVHEKHTPSASPENSVNKPTPDPSTSSVSTSATEAGEGTGQGGSEEKIEEGFVQPNGTYTCVNFAAKTFDNYQVFDASSLDGSYTVYKGSGVALNPSLPVPYRYHVYGEKLTYHLNVWTNSSQNVILGFAEVFPKACASGRQGSFRVFTVSVGDNFQIVDVMKSSGCGVVLQAMFEEVMPKDQVIDLSFSALSGKAMVSVICYGDASPASAESASTQSETSGMPEMGAHLGGSLEDSKQSHEKCFRFGANEVKGFTSFAPSELGKDILMYTDDSASVNGTSHAEVYKSHIFGTQFALILDVGLGTSKTVDLGFAEIYEPGCKEGFRVFSVKAAGESRTVDVFKEVGCNSLFTLQLQNITPSDSGMITIVFNSISNFAMISSICIIDDEGAYTGTSPSLVVVSSGDNSEDDDSALTQADEESKGDNDPAKQTQSEEDLEQSTEPESYDDATTGPSPQGSPFPKQNGIIIAGPTNGNTSQQGPSESPYPKVNGLIDASITTSPTVTESPTAVTQPAFGFGDSGNDTTDDEEEGPSSMDPEEPQPSDELLPSGFSQTTLGEDPNSQTTSSLDPTGSPSEPGLSGVSGEDNSSLTPTPSASLSFTASPGTSSAGDELPIVILPTRTPTPSLSPSPSVGGSNSSVTNKQGDDVTIEAPSPSATALAVVIEAPSPSATGVTVTIEAPSPSVTELIVTIEGPSPSSPLASVTIVGTGPTVSESGAPTPTIISAAAFSPAPSAAMSPSSGENVEESSSTTPQPLVTAAVPGTAPAEPSSPESASPLATSSADEILPPVDSTPDEAVSSSSSSTNTPSVILPEPSGSVTDGSDVLTPVATASGPQATPSGFDPDESAISSPAPATTIMQNQIVVIPSASALAVSTQTPTPGVISPSPPSTQTTEPGGSSAGIGAPDGVVFGSPTPDPTSLIPSRSPIPDLISNPSAVSGSSLRATPSPSRATSSVGSSEVIVDSSTSAPSLDPEPSIAVGGPDEGPVEVSDNTTELLEVTGDIGTGGSEEDNQPSILVGEYKDIIATTPAGSGFAIAMGIVGSLLVILLLVCLFFAIFRGGGAAYSYSSGYSSHKPADYDPSQGRYTDDLGLGPTGYGNESRYDQNAQGGYETEPVTFESRPEGPSEAFGVDMPAAAGLGTAGATGYRNEEPDTIAEYSSLNLQSSRYDVPRPGTTEALGTRETGTEQVTPEPQFLDTNTYHPDKTRGNDSYGSTPGEYTFTGTFSMPNAGYSRSQRDLEHESYRDSGPTVMQQEFQGSSSFQNSFNDNHSTARPTMTSESSGKQGRVQKNLTASKIVEDAKTPEAALVDDVPSSLLDSEQGSSTSMLSMGTNPVVVQSSYETQLGVNMNESESGNVIERDLGSSAGGAQVQLLQKIWRKAQQVAKQDTELPVPLFDRKRSELKTGARNSVQTNAAYHSNLHSSASNGEPWPWWWSGENTGHHRISREHENADHVIDGKENSSFSSNSITMEERYQNPGTRDNQNVGQGGSATPVTAKSADTQTDQRIIPDSSWRRQYSSTSDEDEDETSNPYFNELRRRREPYVRSVANRLSTGPGSFSMSMSGESDPEARKKQVALDNMDMYASRSAREVSSWITRDPVEV